MPGGDAVPHTLRVASTAFASLLFACAAAGQATFEGLGRLPGSPAGASSTSQAAGISADGRVVVGTADAFAGGRAFRWTRETGMTRVAGDLENSEALAASADGSVVVGTALTAGGWAAYRWTAATGTQVLVQAPPRRSARATDVSADGSRVVGYVDDVTGGRAFAWTPSAGASDISDLGGGATHDAATAVSADGSTIVGAGRPPINQHAYRLTALDATDLGDLYTGQDGSVASDVSADGNVVVGLSTGRDRQDGFRWTEQGGMVSLGELPSRPNAPATPLATNADGSVIIGFVQSFGDIGPRPFIWDAAHGVRQFDRVLQDYGADLTGWSGVFPTAVSADGLTFAGTGVNPAGVPEAWIATLPAAAVPEPTTAALLLVPPLALLRRRRGAAPAKCR
jgi:probable HAF family extracellular repeat protein